MCFKIPLLHEMRNDLGDCGDRDLRHNDLAEFIIIGLARLQGRLNVLRQADGINEHDPVSATVFTFEKYVDKSLAFHFRFIAIREPLGKHEPRCLAGWFYETGPSRGSVP